MHFLDFIFRERDNSAQYKRAPSASPSEANDASGRAPQVMVPTPSRPSNVPPHLQLYQARARLLSQGAQQQAESSRPANDSAQARYEALPVDTVPSQQDGRRSNEDLSLASPVLTVDPGTLPSRQPPLPHISSSEQAPAAPPTTAAAADASSGPSPAPAASGSSLGLKDCRSRACAGVVDTFKRALQPRESPSRANAGTGSTGLSMHEGQATAAAATTAAAAAAAVGFAASTSSPAASGDTGSGGERGGIGSELGCPPDTWQLGAATWTFLHSVAAHYPDHPSPRQQELMRAMMEGLAEFYPCEICAEHLRDQVRRQPPQVGTSQQLNSWLCGIHNEVNEMLGKPLFDCSRLLERWRDGPPDGSCD